MGSQTKQILLHALSIAFKVSTALSPSTALQIFIQAGVDIGRDWLLEIPAGLPTVDNILRNSSDMVRAAVSDLTTELDIQNSPLDTTEKFVDKWLKQGNNYSEDESYQISTAFSAYLKEIRLWAVQNPDILLDCIQTLKSVTERQSLVLERHDDAFAEYEKRISQIEDCLQKIIVGHTPKENLLNLSAFDKSKEDRFYNYFFADLSIKIDLVFQSSHLKEIKLVRLYPHLVDYVIYLLEQDDEREYIEAYLNSFVLNPAVRCHYIDMSEQDPNVVERILLLYVLFIKTNRQSYRRKGYSHVLKEILYYVNAYKTNFYLSPGDEYAYTIERYFMRLQLHGLTLRRVNLKNYNFQESVITGDCSFSQ